MRSLMKLFLLAVTFAIPALAHADSFVFTTTDGTATFYIAETPAVTDHSGGYFSISNVSFTGTGIFATPGKATVAFNTAGDFSFGYASGSPFGKHTTSDLPFSGSTDHPTFVLGTYDLSYQSSFGSGPNTAATLVIDTGMAPTPEPSSFILLGTGIMGVAGAARRRFIK